jgi:hypothetical protein
MSTQTAFVTAGATSQSVDISLVQNAGATSPGNPITGLAFNTASLTAYYRVGQTGTLTSISLVTQTAGGAYSSGGFVELSSTNAPGQYRFDIPNAVIASAGEANITFTGAASLATHTIKIICTSAAMFNNLMTTQLTESYAADGVAPTPAQALFLIQQMLTEMSISGTTVTIAKLDGSTTAATCTINNSSNPSSITRTT